MASYSSFFAILLLSFFFLSASGAQPPSSSRPSGLVFSVTIDPSTLQYLTKISLETVPINVVVDLGGESSWIYSSQGCASTSGDVTVQSNNLKNGDWVSGPNVTARGISLGCETTTGVLLGLAKGAEGIAGLGRSGLSLASQLSAAFQLPQKFALDLSSPSGGSMYFGNGPYPDQQLAYTPLITNSCFPSDYFVDVKSMEIDNGNVTYDEGMLSIDNENGVGGTKFSTLVPYTTMETSIYKAFTSIYINRAQAMNISAVAPAWPFHACFSASTIQSRPDGLVVPKILFRLSNNVNWMISPGNALKLVKKDVYCLAFVDGGSKPKTSIVIGGHQMQYNIIEFDVARSRLGFRPRVQI
ncbi:basic 7S globulin 2-like [Papaver somniferum]|uniref:basic 7S globulin 2-like n=1 Tax=Papaver somniferum TaxID=3469 RepID=UPI000E70539D|nr:basic 7S globulin 2-like [Papaver somniferum]